MLANCNNIYSERWATSPKFQQIIYHKADTQEAQINIKYAKHTHDIEFETKSDGNSHEANQNRNQWAMQNVRLIDVFKQINKPSMEYWQAFRLWAYR